jgi:hypothetical protein
MGRLRLKHRPEPVPDAGQQGAPGRGALHHRAGELCWFTSILRRA